MMLHAVAGADKALVYVASHSGLASLPMVIIKEDERRIVSAQFSATGGGDDLKVKATASAPAAAVVARV
jgi:hypothetical protein